MARAKRLFPDRVGSRGTISWLPGAEFVRPWDVPVSQLGPHWQRQDTDPDRIVAPAHARARGE